MGPPGPPSIERGSPPRTMDEGPGAPSEHRRRVAVSTSIPRNDKSTVVVMIVVLVLVLVVVVVVVVVAVVVAVVVWRQY